MAIKPPKQKGTQKTSEALTQARDLIQNAKRVCFLGFGYHPTNVRRLGIKKDREVEGTVYGMTHQEMRQLVQKPYPKHPAPEQLWAECTNLDYLRNHVLLGNY